MTASELNGRSDYVPCKYFVTLPRQSLKEHPRLLPCDSTEKNLNQVSIL